MKTKTNCSRFVILIFALCLIGSIILTGCSTKTPEGVLEDNKQLVRQMNAEVWNKTNLNIMDKFYMPNFVLHFLPDGSDLRGIDSLRAHIREHRKAFPDWSEDIKRIVAERDFVVIQYVSTGTNQGSWLGNSPTGRRIQINEVSIFRIEDGKIAEQWLLPDLFSMQQQLNRIGNE
jgi:predicted ester cyclase